MITRDPSLIHAIHSDRVHLNAHPADELSPSLAQRHEPRIRRLIGRTLVRLGAWVAAERPESLLRQSA